MEQENTRWPYPTQLLLLGVVYILAAYIGFGFALPPSSITVFWPPSGIALAAFILWKPRVWPGVLFGYLIALASYNWLENTLDTHHLLTAFLSAFATTLQTYVAYRLIRPHIAVHNFLGKLPQVLQFLKAISISCLIAPSIGVLSLGGLQLLPWEASGSIWLTWWIGDMLGMLLFTPALVSFSLLSLAHLNRTYLIRGGYFSLITLLVLYVIFIGSVTAQMPLSWLLFALIVWGAFLFGPRGTMIMNLFVAFFAIYSTTLGHAQYSTLAPLTGLLLLQGYVGLLAIMGLHFSAFLNEREQTLKKLTHANAIKSQFLANMSHELRTPLNSMIGFSQIILKNKESNLLPRQIKYMKRIQSNSMHLLRLINNILDLSKIEAGKTELHLEMVELLPLAQEIMTQFEPQSTQKGLALKIEAPAGLSLFQTDPLKLKQILMNLLSNAIKFTAQGHITLRLTAHESGELKSIEVEDTGLGISLENQKKIFEAFTQVSESYARQYEGTGLGLTISHSFCKLLGYELTLKSKVRKGSCFQIVV